MIEIRLTKERVFNDEWGRTMKILILGGTRFFRKSISRRGFKKEGMKLQYLIAERTKKFFLK